MPADFNTPTLATAYTAYLSDLKERDTDALTLCYAGDPSNIPTGAIKYNRGADKFQQWSGTAWVDLILSIAGGGTGGATASATRTALGLGSMALQNSNAVAITDGSIGSGVDIDAGALTSGLVAQAVLGSGSGGAGNNFLADNQTWKPAVSVLTGTGIIWFTNTPPSGYLVCDGSAISRTIYSALFAVLGSTYGAGDGTTTFNLPDLRQKFPIGKAASGTANTLAGTGGAIDHTHTGAAHTHTMGNHTHGAGSLAADSHTHNIDVGTQANVVGGVFSAAGGSDGDVVSSATGGNHSHNTGAVNSGAAAPGVTGSTGAPSSNTSDSTTPGAGGTNNPPFLVINYCIKF